MWRRVHYTGLDWPTVRRQMDDISSSTHKTNYFLPLHAYTYNVRRIHVTRRFPDRRSVPPGTAYKPGYHNDIKHTIVLAQSADAHVNINKNMYISYYLCLTVRRHIHLNEYNQYLRIVVSHKKCVTQNSFTTTNTRTTKSWIKYVSLLSWSKSSSVTFTWERLNWRDPLSASTLVQSPYLVTTWWSWWYCLNDKLRLSVRGPFLF